MPNTYPRSLIKFYEGVALKPSRNAYIDDLEGYLQDSGASYDLECQYVKHDLTLTLKLNLAQANQLQFAYNYAIIQNYNAASQPEGACYYFVTDYKQISQNCIEVSFMLDTINTLGQGQYSVGNPRNFTALTELKRTHKDRFKVPVISGSQYWDPENPSKLPRIVDKISEGTNPILVKKTDELLDSADGFNWYLIYKGAVTESDPVDTYLVADTAINVGYQSQGSSKDYTYADFDNGAYYYFLIVDNPSGAFSITKGTTVSVDTLGTTKTKAISLLGSQYQASQTEGRTLKGIVLHRVGTTLYYTALYNQPFLNLTENPKMYLCGNIANAVVGSTITDLSWSTIDKITITQGLFFRKSNTDYVITNMQTVEAIQDLISTQVGIYIGSGTSQVLSTIADVDRTDQQLIKIIKYPYCPVTYTKTNNIYNFGSSWQYDLGLMKYQGTGVPDLGATNVTSETIYTTDNLLYSPLISAFTYQDAKQIGAESKLYHSDYFTNKIIYDSFATEFKLEDCANNATLENRAIRVDFKPTNTINSKLAFKFTPSGFSRKLEDDFGNFLLVTRNNEETILNNAYINYIRTGYNYDKKSNALAVEAAQRQATATSVGSLVGITASVLGLMFGGAAVKATSLIGLGSSIVSGTLSASNAWANVNQTEQSQENSMQAKLQQLQAQGTSIAGTDDVDLMSYYSDNRLHYISYEPNSAMKDALWKALDLTGYSTVGRGVPQVDSRIWYNYIQCTPSLSIEGSLKLKKEWLDDFKAKYEEGVTVYHKQLINNLPYWGMEMQATKENWETWLVEGVNN